MRVPLNYQCHVKTRQITTQTCIAHSTTGLVSSALLHYTRNPRPTIAAQVRTKRSPPANPRVILNRLSGTNDIHHLPGPRRVPGTSGGPLFFPTIPSFLPFLPSPSSPLSTNLALFCIGYVVTPPKPKVSTRARADEIAPVRIKNRSISGHVLASPFILGITQLTVAPQSGKSLRQLSLAKSDRQLPKGSAGG